MACLNNVNTYNIKNLFQTMGNWIEIWINAYNGRVYLQQIPLANHFTSFIKLFWWIFLSKILCKEANLLRDMLDGIGRLPCSELPQFFFQSSQLVLILLLLLLNFSSINIFSTSRSFLSLLNLSSSIMLIKASLVVVFHGTLKYIVGVTPYPFARTRP